MIFDAETAKKILGVAIDYHFKDDKPGTWRWMVIQCLSDDESGFYYKVNGTGFSSLFMSFDNDNLVIDKIG